jgi:hypothetical protein
MPSQKHMPILIRVMTRPTMRDIYGEGGLYTCKGEF